MNLDNLIDECELVVKKDWKPGRWGPNEGEIVVDVIRHLASRGMIVGEGYVAVPLEPTVCMYITGAGQMEKLLGSDQYYFRSYKKWATKLYKAMIAAAQKGKDDE